MDVYQIKCSMQYFTYQIKLPNLCILTIQNTILRQQNAEKKTFVHDKTMSVVVFIFIIKQKQRETNRLTLWLV